jgi:hypothetical protein
MRESFCRRTLVTKEPDGAAELIGFALNDCVVDIDDKAARYLRAVHRTALELAVQNQFGAEIGGFWLMQQQVQQLRRLPEYYPANETLLVKRAVEAYLRAQIPDVPHLFPITTRGI